jgi:hypothetical protein
MYSAPDLFMPKLAAWLIDRTKNIMKHTPIRRKMLVRALGVGFGAAVIPAFTLRAVASTTPSTLVEVWKSPACGCCKDWMKHLEANGFKTQAFDKGNTAKRSELGMPTKFGSCHTALVNGYVIEGHVPAREIKRLLKEKPNALGLSVPEMPIGSPGMDGPEYAGQIDPYDVLLVLRDGTSRVYQAYRTKKNPNSSAR